MAGNRLTTLPDAIGKLSSLQRLQMAGNLLTSLPDTIGQLTDLEVSCDCQRGWQSWGKVKQRGHQVSEPVPFHFPFLDLLASQTH